MPNGILKILALICSGLGFVSLDSAAADVRFEKEGSICTISVEGTIDKNTPQQLKIAIDKVKRNKCGTGESWASSGTVELSSPGGDMEAAIESGRLIRRTSLSTRINRSCASACVLVQLGGVLRSVFGKIGLHQPYSTSYSDSIASAEVNVQKANGLISSYLAEMHIPLRLLDVMNATSPGDVRWLDPFNYDEYEKLVDELQIRGWDPVFRDVFDSNMAKVLGLSRSEYYARQQRATFLCKNKIATDSYWECFRSVFKDQQ